MRDDLDVDFPGAIAFEEVGGGVSHVAAERLERVPFDMQSFDIGALILELSTYQTWASSSKAAFVTATRICGTSRWRYITFGG
jgi:hypothetical protein